MTFMFKLSVHLTLSLYHNLCLIVYIEFGSFLLDILYELVYMS